MTIHQVLIINSTIKQLQVRSNYSEVFLYRIRPVTWSALLPAVIRRMLTCKLTVFPLHINTVGLQGVRRTTEESQDAPKSGNSAMVALIFTSTSRPFTLCSSLSDSTKRLEQHLAADRAAVEALNYVNCKYDLKEQCNNLGIVVRIRCFRWISL